MIFMWILQLNPMQGNFEYLTPVGRADSRESLVAFLAREQVEPYSDDDGQNMMGGKLLKSFRKGGPLEFLNPPDRDECWVEYDMELDVRSYREMRERKVFSIPLV